MIKLDVKTNVNEIAASLKKYVGEQQQAVVRALNKTATQARTAASQEVRSAGYNVKASAIKSSFAIDKARRGKLLVTLRATGKPIALVNYGARQGRSGVSVQVKTGRQVLRHAFIATMPNGHKGVFQRIGKGHKRVVKNGRTMQSGLPIKELFGPSIPSALGNEAVQRAIMKKIREKFPAVLEHELAFAKRSR